MNQHCTPASWNMFQEIRLCFWEWNNKKMRWHQWQFYCEMIFSTFPLFLFFLFNTNFWNKQKPEVKRENHNMKINSLLNKSKANTLILSHRKTQSYITIVYTYSQSHVFHPCTPVLRLPAANTYAGRHKEDEMENIFGYCQKYGMGGRRRGSAARRWCFLFFSIS